MKGYTSSAGASIPTNQRDEYDKSVHSTALTKQNDLSAPTCNDCHGNHGAAPPGVGAMSNVCGTCHAVFAAKFATSAHSQIFDRACVECHGNHAVLTTSDEMIGTSKDTLCFTCHEGADDAGSIAAGRMRTSIENLKASLASNSDLIARVRNAGMEVSDQELALAEVRTKLTQARTEIHSFDPAAVDLVVNEGMKALTAVGQAGNQALADFAVQAPRAVHLAGGNSARSRRADPEDSRVESSQAVTPSTRLLDRVAELAVLTEHPAIFGHEGLVVTTEATLRYRVADAIGIGAPADFHFWKDVRAVNGRETRQPPGVTRPRRSTGLPGADRSPGCLDRYRPAQRPGLDSRRSEPEQLRDG